MPADPISSGYARSFLAVAQAENAVTRVEEELHQLRTLLKTTPDLLKFLKDPNIKHEGKRKALADLFESRVHPIVLNGLITLSDLDHAGLLPHVIDEFLSAAAASKQKVTGEITTAIPLDAATLQRIVAELQRTTGKHVELMQKVDPAILGGAVIQVGEEVIDGSLRRRLNDIQERLKQ